MHRSVLALLPFLSGLAVALGASQHRQVPIRVRAEQGVETLRSGESLPLRVTISNGLSQKVFFSTYSLTPNAWNGETANISLVDIYRDERELRGIFLARPRMEAPMVIAGMSAKTIGPGDALTIVVDMAKWTVNGGWTPGKYKVTVRADNIRVDEYTTASVMSDTVRFEIR